MATLVAHQKGWKCQKWQDFIHAIAKKWHGVYAQALDAFFSISNCSGLEWPWKIAHGSYGLGPSFGLHGLPMAGSTFAGWLLGGLGLSGILGLGGLGGLGLHGLAWVGASPLVDTFWDGIPPWCLAVGAVWKLVKLPHPHP